MNKSELSIIDAIKDELNMVRENVPKVYKAGYEQGKVEGGGLPSVTIEDNDKVLTVVEGKWAAKELPKYNGEYSVMPNAENDVILETSQKFLDADIKVNKIPYSEVSNNSGGNTVFIGSEV